MKQSDITDDNYEVQQNDYKLNEENKEIIINNGYYTIDELLKSLNNNEDNIIFELDSLTQKIKIKSETDISIINTPLSYNNLGFTTFEIEEKELISDVIWDLRIDNKVYLFFTNLNDAPFAVLNPNNTINESEMKFEDDVPLEYLDIVFKDSKGNEINFYKINHYLNLQITANE